MVIATPHDTPRRLGRRALTAGTDVLCEKPLALTGEDLDEMEEAWRAGRVL